MRANHFVTLGLCVGVVGLGAAAGACGTDTSGTCMDTNSCGPSSEGGGDDAMPDVNLGDTMGDEEAGPIESGPKDGGGDVKSDAPSDGPLMCEGGLQDCKGQCVNVNNDPNNCGECGVVCSAPDGGMGTATCSGSPPMCAVMCGSGYHMCNGQCLSDGDDPSNDPCVVADGLGVFASPTGSDSTGNGTKQMPFATIAHAADVAATGKKRVYACGTFTSAVALTAADNGVTIYGGLDCTTWAYSMSTPTAVAPSAPGYALQISNASGVTFEDFTFTSLAGVNPGDSSMTAFVTGSSSILFKRVSVTAGMAVDGQNQTQPVPSAAATDGNGGSLTTGGGLVMNGQCSSTGGAGGQPGTPPGNDGSDGTPAVASNKGLAAAGDCGNGSSGKNGASGSAGADGAGAASWASFTSTGWSPSAGLAGSMGGIAQGGGGGAALDLTGGGGSGGAGGCGGIGGLAGTGAGSSVAVLVYQSSVDLEACSLTAVAAGDGGQGAAGQAGQTGGTHGNGFGNACPGGKGGTGGNGGGGGGGAGGISAGVLWIGTAPTINGVSTPSAATLPNVSTAAAGGTAGPGGGSANTGKAGTAGAVVQFQ